MEIGRFRGGDGVGLGIGRWEELDLDPTTPPGCCRLQRDASSVARLGGFEFDYAGKYWLGRVDKIWAGFWSVWRFSKHINCID